MAKVFNYILSGILRVLSKLSFKTLYVFSDIICFFAYYIIRYRRKVLRENLTNAFPEKNKNEIIILEKKFYRHLSDSFLEAVKVLDMDKSEKMKRMKFLNSELVDEHIKNGESIILCLGHYGNWEWIPSLYLWIKEDCFGGQLYRPLKNTFFDQFYLDIRQKWGTICIPKNDVLREIRNIKETKRPFLIGFMADQTPSKTNIHYWTQFLNQESAILIGPEKIASKGNYTLLYLDIKRVSRGYYTGEYKLITDKPKESAPFYITETYVRMMEETILRDPAFWLWTHKRWKHKKE